MNEELKTLAEMTRREIGRTWNAIGPDAVALGVETSDEAMEMVLDADRLTTFGGPDGKAADDLVGEAVMRWGWLPVVERLAELIPLM